MALNTPSMQLLILKDVLVAARLDAAGDVAVSAAARLAKAAGARLHAVLAGAAGRETADDFRAMLERAGASIAPDNVYVLEGDPSLQIGRLADRLEADVIVLGRGGPASPGARRLGGTALAVVTNASSPCLIVPGALHLPLRRILVPIDLSDSARGALMVGLSWASALRTAAHDTTLTALHVQAPAGGGGAAGPSAFLEREVEFTREAAGTWAMISIEKEVVVDENPSRGIATFAGAHRPDLIVMGTRGLGLDSVGRLGSAAASVIAALDVPVLLVPPAVWTNANPDVRPARSSDGRD